MFTDKDAEWQPLLGVYRKSNGYFVYLAGAIASLLGLSSGIAIAWTSPVLPKLTGNHNVLGRPISTNEESWITGWLYLGSVFSPLIAGPIADRIGRKKTLLVVAIPMGAALAIVAFTRTVLMWYVARFLMGISVGSVFTVLPIYLNEISEDRNRGTLGCFITVAVAAGSLYSYAIGPFFTIQTFSLACLIPLLVFVPVFGLWNPETPHFSALRNDKKDLEASLWKLRSKTVLEVKEEMLRIIETVSECAAPKSRLGGLLCSRPMVITLGLMGVQQFSGITAITSYMQTILESAHGLGPAPKVSTTIIGAVQVGATVLAVVLVDRVGRRLLLIVSTIGCCLSLACLCVYFHFDTSAIGSLPIISLVFFMVNFGVGLGSVPWTIMTELFPVKLKSVAATLATIFCFVGAFVTTFLFPMMTSKLGMGPTFGIFACVCAAGAVFIYWGLPETKGKSLQQIQKVLSTNTK